MTGQMRRTQARRRSVYGKINLEKTEGCSTVNTLSCAYEHFESAYTEKSGKRDGWENIK